MIQSYTALGRYELRTNDRGEKHRCKCCCLPPDAPQSLRQAGRPSGIFPWSFFGNFSIVISSFDYAVSFPLLIMRFFPFVSIHGKIL